MNILSFNDIFDGCILPLCLINYIFIGGLVWWMAMFLIHCYSEEEADQRRESELEQLENALLLQCKTKPCIVIFSFSSLLAVHTTEFESDKSQLTITPLAFVQMDEHYYLNQMTR